MKHPLELIDSYLAEIHARSAYLFHKQRISETAFLAVQAAGKMYKAALTQYLAEKEEQCL